MKFISRSIALALFLVGTVAGVSFSLFAFSVNFLIRWYRA
jgi:hypothetical protein